MKKDIKKVIVLFILFLMVKLGYSQIIGANFNEHVEDIKPELITKANVKWVRTFINIPREFLKVNKEGEVLDVNRQAIEDFDISNLTSLKDCHIILSLKLDFKFKKIGVPLTNSPEEQYLFSAVNLLLKKNNLGAKVDILVVGNEPMWETPKGDSDKLGNLFNRLIAEVNQQKTLNHWNYEIFIGALNRVSELKNNEIAVELLKIAKENPLVNGIDLHIHTDDLKKAYDDPAYIRDVQNIDKKVICTEFSLVRLFEKHINDKLGEWGEQNGYDKEMKMYEWLNLLRKKAIDGSPVSQSVFYNFFESQNWYPKQWFNTFLTSFKAHNVAVATYGLQSKLTNKGKILTPQSQLWVLNFVFNGGLLGNGKQGIGNTNPLVYPEFKASVK